MTRCAATGSTHSGSIAATVRAHSREVSTSSAATTQSGGLRARPEPGKTANLVPRAPRYSGSGRLPRSAPPGPPGRAPGDGLAGASTIFMPTCDKQPGEQGGVNPHSFGG